MCPACEEEAAGAVVEFVDVVPAHGDHEDAFAGVVGGEVVAHEVVAGSVGGGFGGDALVEFVEGECLVGAAFAEVGEGLLFPGFVLASVFFEVDAADVVVERAEHAAGVDFGELFGVADEDGFDSGGFGGVEEWGEGAGAGHAGFVDDEDGQRVKGLSVGEFLAERGDGEGADPGPAFELVCCAGGYCAADDPVAGGAPGVVGCGECGGLAGAGGGDDDVDAASGGGEDAGHPSLFVTEVGVAAGSCDEVRAVDHADTLGRTRDGLGEESLFEREQFGARVAGSEVGGFHATAIGAPHRDRRLTTAQLDHRRIRECPPCELFDLGDGCAGREFVAPGLEDVAAVER